MSPAKSAKDAKVKSELPAASCGVSEERDENYPKGVTPECFYRGSSQSFAWIPLQSCGNDGLRKEN